MAYSRYDCSSSKSVIVKTTNKLTVESCLSRKHKIIISRDLFSAENDILKKCMQDREGMFVISSRVNSLFGVKIKQYIRDKFSNVQDNLLVIDCGEQNKNYHTIEKIIEKAAAIHLDRQSPIVGIGGGICTDICGLAATLFRRGVPHIKIPTTLVGLIDAGIGIKNGINFGAKKNLIGSFVPPEYSLIDCSFLPTLSNRHIMCGVSEILKMGIIVDKIIYEILEKCGKVLIKTKFQYPVEEAMEVINRSIISMMKELANNLFEVESYKRAVDFGHTFSPYIEAVSNYSILHGEAVSIDMALSCQIAYKLGIFPKSMLDTLFHLFEALELPIYTSLIEPTSLFESLRSIEAHRGGDLNLVVPSTIGSPVFIDKNSFGLKLLEESLDDLRKRRDFLQSRNSSMVYQATR